VARVSEVVHDPGEPFARVTAAPVAQLQRSRHFLLLFPPSQLRFDDPGWQGDIHATAIEAARAVAADAVVQEEAARDVDEEAR